VNLSTSHLGRLFKAAMGTSIVQYTIELRLKDARQLLQTTDWPVKRIAIECGIPDGPNFVRLFKRRFRMTPSECRNNHHCEALPPSEDDEAGGNTL